MMSATPMFDDQGKVRGGIAAILDITERRVAEAHQRVLLYELQHRVKNIITTIGALASRMMKDSRSLEEFSLAFLGRLRAMATTHELLSHGNWTGASLRALIEAALQAHLGHDRTTVALRGPDLTLTPSAGRRWAWCSTSLPPTQPSTAACRPTDRSPSPGVSTGRQSWAAS